MSSHGVIQLCSKLIYRHSDLTFSAMAPRGHIFWIIELVASLSVLQVALVTGGGSGIGFEISRQLGSNPFLSWIFSASSCGDQLTLWTRAKEDKKRQGIELIQTLEKEFYHLQSLSEKKCERMNYEEALQVVEDLCLEEGKKRENFTEFVQQSYGSVLRKRREELIESDNDVMYVSNRFELDAITNVLQEAESMNRLNTCGAFRKTARLDAP